MFDLDNIEQIYEMIWFGYVVMYCMHISSAL